MGSRPWPHSTGPALPLSARAFCLFNGPPPPQYPLLPGMCLRLWPLFASFFEPKPSFLHLILRAPSVFFVKATLYQGYATSTHSTMATTYATVLQGCLRWSSTSSGLSPPHPTLLSPQPEQQKNVYPPTFPREQKIFDFGENTSIIPLSPRPLSYLSESEDFLPARCQ